MRIRIKFFILMRIRIQLPIKVKGICDHWSLDHQGAILSLQASIVIVYGPPRLYFEPLKFLKLNSDADQDLCGSMRIRIRNPATKY